MILISYGIALKSDYEKFKGADNPAAWVENLNRLLRGAFKLNLPAAFNPAKHALNPLGTVVVPRPWLIISKTGIILPPRYV
jgi:hypothetical protein